MTVVRMVVCWWMGMVQTQIKVDRGFDILTHVDCASAEVKVHGMLERGTTDTASLFNRPANKSCRFMIITFHQQRTDTVHAMSRVQRATTLVHTDMNSHRHWDQHQKRVLQIFKGLLIESCMLCVG